jgi:hypothetical protein
MAYFDRVEAKEKLVESIYGRFFERSERGCSRSAAVRPIQPSNCFGNASLTFGCLANNRHDMLRSASNSQKIERFKQLSVEIMECS